MSLQVKSGCWDYRVWSDLLLTVNRALNTSKRRIIRRCLMSVVKRNGGVTNEDLKKHKKEISESVLLNFYPGGQNFIRYSEVIRGMIHDCRHIIQMWCMFVRASLYKRREENQLDATECFIAIIICSTYFGHLYAHHQELETLLVLLPHTVCNALFAGGRRSGAGQQAMCPGWGMLFGSVEQHPSSRTLSLLPYT